MLGIDWNLRGVRCEVNIYSLFFKRFYYFIMSPMFKFVITLTTKNIETSSPNFQITQCLRVLLKEGSR